MDMVQVQLFPPPPTSCIDISKAQCTPMYNVGNAVTLEEEEEVRKAKKRDSSSVISDRSLVIDRFLRDFHHG